MMVISMSPIESAISHAGTSKGMRAIITMGDVRGMMENQNESELSGFCIVPMATTRPSIIGIVTLSTADPIAANTEAYRRYPVRKKKMKLKIMSPHGWFSAPAKICWNSVSCSGVTAEAAPGTAWSASARLWGSC